jgi:hypothetical protein
MLKSKGSGENGMAAIEYQHVARSWQRNGVSGVMANRQKMAKSSKIIVVAMKNNGNRRNKAKKMKRQCGSEK